MVQPRAPSGPAAQRHEYPDTLGVLALRQREYQRPCCTSKRAPYDTAQPDVHPSGVCVAPTPLTRHYSGIAVPGDLSLEARAPGCGHLNPVDGPAQFAVPDSGFLRMRAHTEEPLRRRDLPLPPRSAVIAA